MMVEEDRGDNQIQIMEKSKDVRRQLQLWETLLEVRLKLQKCLNASNRMPKFDIYRDDSEFVKNCDTVNNKIKILLTKMLNLQKKHLYHCSETRDISLGYEVDKVRKFKPKNVDAPSDMEEDDEFDTETYKSPKKLLKLDQFERIIGNNHDIFKEYRNSVIQKWDDKVRVATGGISKVPNQSILQKIEFALKNKDELRKRTQLQCSVKIKEKITSNFDGDKKCIQEYDGEIYNDDNFYHQLVKELIEFKSTDVQDPLKFNKQWFQLQSMRNKMKRKIDPKATKGRKLRYDVQHKLVNFMAPVITSDTWTSHTKDQLNFSLFGKSESINAKSLETS